MLNYDIRLSYVCYVTIKSCIDYKSCAEYANGICINLISLVHKYQCDKVEIITSEDNLCNIMITRNMRPGNYLPTYFK